MADAKGFFEAVADGDRDRVATMLDDDPALADAVSDAGIGALLHALYHRQGEIAALVAGRKTALDLFEAAATGDRAEVARNLAAGTAVDARAADGFTALHLAAFFGQPEMIQYLLDRGADANVAAENAMAVCPLHSAAAAGSVESVSLLLSAGAAPDARQHGGWTALHAAAAHGIAPMVDRLLAHGATAGLPNDDGKTAHDLATENGHAALALTLSAAGETH